MKPGRKPTPTALKKLRGNPGKRVLVTSEPKFDPVTHLNPPEWLNEVAKSEWRRVAPQLFAQDLFSEVDHASLSAYCVAYSRWRQAEQLVQQQIDKSSKPVAGANALELPLAMEFRTLQGYAQQIPQIGIANSYLDKMRSLAAEFGFTPASRSRLAWTGGEIPKGDPYEEYLKRGAKDGAAAAEAQA